MAQAKKPASAEPAKKPAARKASAKAAVAALDPAPETLRDQASNMASKASDKAREYANSGKEKATGALDEISHMVENVAKTIDEKVGAQYGDYARRAAGAVSGVADALKSKDVDDLVSDARNFVRDKPAVAIGVAAAVGFVLTRLVKAGSNDGDDA
jgi:ElaB/YqjD/DUF883 family membrane-anchored ribosome-binding protein